MRKEIPTDTGEFLNTWVLLCAADGGTHPIGLGLALFWQSCVLTP